MKHFLDHLAGPVGTWWDDLGKPELTPQIRTMLVEGVKAEAAGRTNAELETERDQRLLSLLMADPLKDPVS
jgi:hypothetical protein